ncbi:MAG: hypothetical protein ISR51_05700 [Rhodospirillales bacterium]|nr:hypothetical protein [Alphaproteobacteria bacterium]MBL6948151.1 hypothetical protein [Rhodospirillales bacterium]
MAEPGNIGRGLSGLDEFVNIRRFPLLLRLLLAMVICGQLASQGSGLFYDGYLILSEAATVTSGGVDSEEFFDDVLSVTANKSVPENFYWVIASVVFSKQSSILEPRATGPPSA